MPLPSQTILTLDMCPVMFAHAFLHMYVLVCGYVCMYLYMYECTYVKRYIYILISVYVGGRGLPSCVFIYICEYAFPICMCICVKMCTLGVYSVIVLWYMCGYIYIYSLQIHMYMYICVYIYVHVGVHIDMVVGVCMHM